VHVSPNPNDPLESLENVTVPDGAFPPTASETIAVHEVDTPEAIGEGEQETEVEVGDVAPAEPVNTYAAPCCWVFPSCSDGALATIVPPSMPTE
jgi:hypothetical protein